MKTTRSRNDSKSHPSMISIRATQFSEKHTIVTVSRKTGAFKASQTKLHSTKPVAINSPETNRGLHSSNMGGSSKLHKVTVPYPEDRKV